MEIIELLQFAVIYEDHPRRIQQPAYTASQVNLFAHLEIVEWLSSPPYFGVPSMFLYLFKTQ